MKITTPVIVLLVCIVHECSGLDLGDVHVVDLTHSINASTVYWPGLPALNFTVINRETVDNHWYESNYIGTAEHGGTHLDSPSHFSQGKWRVHDIPIHRLIGPAVVINVTSKANVDPDYRVDVSDLESWESKYGQIPHGAIVLMKSGWSAKYPNKVKVMNSRNVDDYNTFHFPSFHEDAATWLVERRNVSMVGVDTPSTDYGQTKSFPVHQILGHNSIIGLENVANLEKIPEHGATIFVGVIKLHDGSGGPARIIAVYSDNTSHNYHMYFIVGLTVLVALIGWLRI